MLGGFVSLTSRHGRPTGPATAVSLSGSMKIKSNHSRQHLAEKRIKTEVIHWGAPTLVIRDVDANELFFWLPESERAA